MISINGFEKEFILDLIENPYDEHTFTVSSEGNNGSSLPWGVEIISCNLVKAIPSGGKLNVNVDAESIDEECFIYLKNYAKERIKIKIKPNPELSAPKQYKFRITKKSVDGRKVKIRILSKENSKEIGWKCTYDGRPIRYAIQPMESDRSGYVDIILQDKIFSKITNVIEFTQDKSGKMIKLNLGQDDKNTTIEKAG